MNKSNLTHTFHGGAVPILRSAIKSDRGDYEIIRSREIRKRDNIWAQSIVGQISDTIYCNDFTNVERCELIARLL